MLHWQKALPTWWKAPSQKNYSQTSVWVSSLPGSGFCHVYDLKSTSQSGLQGRASSWPWETQTPEMKLLLLVPKRMALAKGFFLSYPVPGTLQWWGCYSWESGWALWGSGTQYHREQPSYQSALRSTAPQRVSSLEYLHLNSSNRKVHLDRWAKGSLTFGSAVKVVFILKINQFYSSSKQNQQRLYVVILNVKNTFHM